MIDTIATLTPAEIDALWIEALVPVHKLRERANEQERTANRYRKAGGRYIEDADRHAQQAHELWIEANELQNEIDKPFRAEWDARNGWTRAYVVPDGHIHRSTSCHTLHPTTLVAWLPEQSGLSEDEIVERAGVHACTVCYPSAPVDALRAAEAAAKAATECDGSRGYDYDQATFRQTSYTGSGVATCRACGARISVTRTGKLKAHAKIN